MSREDMFDRDSIESVHEHTSESEIRCTHKLKDGKSAWRVLLGRCVAQCSVCGEENDLNPLVTPQLQADRASTLEETVTAVLLQAIRIQAKYLDAGDL